MNIINFSNKQTWNLLVVVRMRHLLFSSMSSYIIFLCISGNYASNLYPSKILCLNLLKMKREIHIITCHQQRMNTIMFVVSRHLSNFVSLCTNQQRLHSSFRVVFKRSSYPTILSMNVNEILYACLTIIVNEFTDKVKWNFSELWNKTMLSLE